MLIGVGVEERKKGKERKKGWGVGRGVVLIGGGYFGLHLRDGALIFFFCQADTELRPVFMYSIARGRQMEKPRQMDRLKNQTFDPVNHK